VGLTRSCRRGSDIEARRAHVSSSKQQRTKTTSCFVVLFILPSFSRCLAHLPLSLSLSLHHVQARPERPGLDSRALLSQVVRLRQVPRRGRVARAEAPVRHDLWLQAVQEGLHQGHAVRCASIHGGSLYVHSHACTRACICACVRVFLTSATLTRRTSTARAATTTSTSRPSRARSHRS